MYVPGGSCMCLDVPYMPGCSCICLEVDVMHMPVGSCMCLEVAMCKKLIVLNRSAAGLDAQQDAD